MNLTEAQQEAINSINTNLQIIACAGSGKTQVVSERIVNILKQDGVEPRNIVAFTYTEKAAAELKSRVLRLAREQLHTMEGMAELYIGTIHAWCMHYLQDHIYGYQKFSVLNDIRLKLFIDQRNRKIGMSDLMVHTKGKPPRELKRFVETDKFTQVMGIARECRIKDGMKLPEDIQNVVEKYEQQLSKHAYFDFTMILTNFLEELKTNSELREKIKDQLKYLIIDEYQDVNYIQEQIIEEINKFGAKLCVVGDDDQTIYQWRGSTLHNILGFREKYTAVQQVTLDDNFRSSKGIVEVAKAGIDNLAMEERLPKSMNAAGFQQYEEGDLQLGEFPDYEQEDAFIIERIQGLRGKAFRDFKTDEPRGLDYSDMAILLRAWKPATRLAEILRAANIPFVVTGVAQLFETEEAKACIDIYKYLHGEITGHQLKTSWKNVSAGINDKNLENAIHKLNESRPNNKDWHELFNLQEIFIEFRENADITEERISGSSDQGMSRAEVVFYNMGMFSQVIEDFEVIHFKDDQQDKLVNFINFLKYSAKDYYPEGWLNKSMAPPNAVTITTVHQAKGLEWPVVFIPRMNKNYFPTARKGGVSPWHILNENLIHNVEGLKGSESDELRLFYVALTRSKKFLFVSRAPGESTRDKRPSKFFQYLKDCPYIFRDPDNHFKHRPSAPMRDVRELGDIVLNFSLLEAFYKCPYSFKYYTLYGFKEALSPRIGYGKSIHDTLMEIHREAMDGHPPSRDKLPEILDRHVHFPYAIPKVKEEMRDKAEKAVEGYFDDYENEFKDIEYAEKDIELNLGDGIIVNGRMDLIKKRDLDGERRTYIIDFKSEYDAEKHEITVKQLLLYALGYKELTGNNADYLEVYDFKEGRPNTTRLNNNLLEEAKEEIRRAADRIRKNELVGSCGKSGCPCRFQKSR